MSRPTTRTLAALAIGLAALLRPAAAVQLDLDPATVSEAVLLGQSAVAADRARFHQPYRFDVRRPPVDVVDIVTPFRRVEIAAELAARAGLRRFGQKDGLAVASTQPGRVSVHIELTFHPLNTYVMVPQYTVVWATRRGNRVEPASVESAARYIPRIAADALPVPVGMVNPGGAVAGGAPGRSGPAAQPLLGATVVAYFDGRRLTDPADGAVEVLVEEAGRELARLPVVLSNLR